VSPLSITPVPVVVHKYVTPVVVVPVPSKVTVVVEHVNSAVAPASAVGAIVSKVVVADAVSVHPFAPVTVTVNVPAVVTSNVDDVLTTLVPSDHE